MEILEQLYEGKAKKVFKTSDPDLYMVRYKDDATAFNGAKKGTISEKGIVNNKMSNRLMQQLAGAGIPTHFVEELSDRETLVKRVQIVPLEVIVRNVAAGSFAQRFAVTEGTLLKQPTLEFCYKNDALNDPMINNYQIVALDLATEQELDEITKIAFAVNTELQKIFAAVNIRLIDFKIECGRLDDGTIILADEISPDTCRLWDATTNDKLDKDRFRRDLGGEVEAYQEVARRLKL
ncbi:MAG TPA: phosphoribosylaminoimidazolesuccinocarboxamide synthase [Candidatus Avidehalobacter gallistercoris]|uniref:Phosphoribosylaminoimidazole-succinocarboxamide synthase n=1 Tax=Candidatus Avidehalobacter gallistercoris TaxID=2840694 RepID=A0A9D1KXC3_9FIRM|nr:phosphoribosylaminoimidazolesuccinocarboxamide synthase [Candidatus Avidehalobacter gallistercoris]